MDTKSLLDFIFELGGLKKIKHEGWRFAGISDPESVADHALRAAQIGFILAKLEKFKNPYEVCTMVAFHDIGECRIGDIHRIGKMYLQADEEGAVKDQTRSLGDMGKEIFSLWEQVEKKHTKAGIIAKDADLLEQAFSAKEYMEQGFVTAQNWIDNVAEFVQTKTAKKLVSELQKRHSYEWWLNLKKAVS